MRLLCFPAALTVALALVACDLLEATVVEPAIPTVSSRDRGAECIVGGAPSDFCDSIGFFDGIAVGRIVSVTGICDFHSPDGELIPASACSEPTQCGVEVELEQVRCFPGEFCTGVTFVIGAETLTNLMYFFDPESGEVISTNANPAAIAIGKSIGIGLVEVGDRLAAGPGLLLSFDDDGKLLRDVSEGCERGTALNGESTVDSVWELVEDCDGVGGGMRTGYDYFGQCLAPTSNEPAHCDTTDDCEAGRDCDPQTRWCVFQCSSDADCLGGECVLEDDLRFCRNEE